MDTNSVMRRGRNERVYRCAGPCAGPALGRRNVGTVDENFALGKNPCAHRPGFVRFHVLGAPIAQLDRASDYGSEGYRFNSYWVRQLLLGFSRIFGGCAIRESRVEYQL